MILLCLFDGPACQQVLDRVRDSVRLRRLALAAFDEAAREAGPGIGEPASLTVSRALLTIMDSDLDGVEAILLAALERLPPIPLVRVIVDSPLATIALLNAWQEPPTPQWRPTQPIAAASSHGRSRRVSAAAAAAWPARLRPAVLD